MNKLRILAILGLFCLGQFTFAQATDEKKIFHSIAEGLEEPENVEYLEVINLTDKDSLELLNRFPHLLSLSLIDYHYSTAPEAISNISSLKELKLINDDFYTIPKSYANLTNLKRLEFIYDTHLNIQSAMNLANTLPALTELKIEGLMGPTFPDNIPFPSQLKFLSLRNNHLNQLPVTIKGIANLEILDVGNNELLEIPEFLSNLTKLNTIYLDQQPFLHIDYTFNILQKVPNLKFVHLEGNHLEWEKIQPYQDQSLFKIFIDNDFTQRSILYNRSLDMNLPKMPKFSDDPDAASFKIPINY